MKLLRFVALAAAIAAASVAQAAPIYLNAAAGISVSLNSGSLTGGSLSNVIDAPDAGATEVHGSSTHAYISGSGAQMDLRFDLGADYDLQTFHLWNIETPVFTSWSVGDFRLDFLASDLGSLGTFAGVSTTGGNADPSAEDFTLGTVTGVRYVDVLLTGMSSGVDIINIGFTAVPEPGLLALLGLGLPGFVRIARLRR